MPRERIRMVADRKDALNKQLVSAYRNRRIERNPLKWETAGSFRCIDEDGKKIEGTMFRPLGKISVNHEYADIDFDGIKAKLEERLDAAKKRLKE